MNATIRENITLARECVIGASTLIMKDTVEKGVYLGKAGNLYAKRSDELSNL